MADGLVLLDRYHTTNGVGNQGESIQRARAGGVVVLVGVSLKPMRVDLTPAYDLVTDLLLQSGLTTEGLITHRFPLDQWRRAVRTALDKQIGAIKVVLDCRSEF